MNVVLLEAGEVGSDGTVSLAGARATHLRQVLAIARGQTVRVGIVDGPHGRATVTELGDATVSLHCAFEATPPARPAVDVLLAVPRPKVLRRLWAQLAAVGVGRIMLTNAARVERNYFDTHVLEPHAYRPLLVEGLQQARDTRLPVVTVHRQFKVLVEDHLDALSDDAVRIVADPRATTPIGAALQGRSGDRVLLAIGPEGGWNDFELDLLARHRFDAIGMGARTLRVDTACIALLALVHAAIAPGTLAADPIRNA